MNIFTLKPKLTILICTIIISVISIIYGRQLLFYYKYKPINKNASAKILLLWRDGFSERESIERLKIAAKLLVPPVEVKVISNSTRYDSNTYNDKVPKAIKIFKPDFIITLEHFVKYYPGATNYLVLSFGTEHYITKTDKGDLAFTEENYYKFDAVLPSFKEKDVDLLQAVYATKGRDFVRFPWYYSSYVTTYKPAIPKKLLYSGGTLWDKTRGSSKYTELFEMLDKTGYLQVTGPKAKWKHTPNSRIGIVPFDGHSMIDKLHNAGVSLILHTKEHISGGSPTSRIFEAAAANVAIISDKHPFIQEHFGDNVLYIDIDQDVSDVFKQINAHMNWILANLQEAQRMAANCNQIYKQKFSLEDQLSRLVAMHMARTKAEDSV